MKDRTKEPKDFVLFRVVEAVERSELSPCSFSPFVVRKMNEGVKKKRGKEQEERTRRGRKTRLAFHLF